MVKQGIDSHPAYELGPEAARKKLEIKSEAELAKEKKAIGAEHEGKVIARNLDWAKSISEPVLVEQYTQRAQERLAVLKSNPSLQEFDNEIELLDTALKSDRKIQTPRGEGFERRRTEELIDTFIRSYKPKLVESILTEAQIVQIKSTLPKKGFYETNNIPFRSWIFSLRRVKGLPDSFIIKLRDFLYDEIYGQK